MSRYISERLKAFAEYVPGEQPQDRKYIKLNTNESPYPPSPSVLKVINSEEAAKLRLYSDPESRLLKEKTAEYYGVGKENIFISNGSDEILNFAFMAYGHMGAVFPDITYGFYSVFAKLHGIKADIVPLKDDFSIDLEKMLINNRLTVIANPNAPTGIFLDLSEIEKILKANIDGVVIVDEAYVDFGSRSALNLIGKYDNLLVVRTYSKSRSMAGARLGYAFANSAIIADLEKIKYSTNPYNVNRLTQAAGVAALCDKDYYSDNCKKIIETRDYTKQQLQKLGFEITDSKANFIFAKSNRISGQALYEKLKEKGILIRHFNDERIKDYNRITVGSKEEMEIFIQKIKEIIGGQL